MHAGTIDTIPQSAVGGSTPGIRDKQDLVTRIQVGEMPLRRELKVENTLMRAGLHEGPALGDDGKVVTCGLSSMKDPRLLDGELHGRVEGGRSPMEEDGASGMGLGLARGCRYE